MRKMIIGRLAAVAIVLFVGIQLSAQSITINNAQFSAGPYANGGGITVPIQLNGCFNPGNNFQLFLSDASGNFPGTLIGTYNSFFTPFVNGIIPAGTAPGANYRVRVVSTNPAGIEATSNPFTVSGTTLPTVPNLSTSTSNTINDTTYGRCLLISNTTLNLGLTLPGGTTMEATVLDSLGNSITATVGANSISFQMVVGNYYTVQVRLRHADNSISVKSFLVLASTSNLSLQTSGSNEICLPDVKAFTINITAAGGIRNNYPGTTYTLDWGDGSSTSYTHCDLMNRGGLIEHVYTQTSCGRPPIVDINPNQFNAFRVTLTGANQFCNTSFTPISSFAKVWDRPIANFVNPEYGCINTPITFVNTSQAGLSGNNNAVNCTNTSQYEWYVDGVFVSDAVTLVHTFTTPGNHTVQLVALNDPCSDDTTMVICIETVPQPDFLMNGLTAIAGCGPLVVNVSNTTNTNICRPYVWNWQVFRVPSMAPATVGVHYNITPGPTSENPTITFLQPGDYIIRLTIGNSCGTFTRDRTVSVLLNADVTIPGNQQYCDLRTINFLSSPGHVTTYNVNSGALTYNWNISPATFSFVGGTSASSSHPQVQFNAFGTYTITVTFTNDCGTDQATQQITFFQPVTANAGPDQSVCFDVPSVNLNGASSGPPGYTAVWSVQPGFGTQSNISNANIANPNYTFNAQDRTNGQVRLIYTATPPGGSICPVVRDTVVITIFPDNNITSAATRSICSGVNLNYLITSSVTGSTFNWTSSVISGTATGNTPSGSGSPISDVLVNTSNSTNAVVRYIITPVANGCNGNPFQLDVTVRPVPEFTPAPSATTVCSGQPLSIALNSALVGAQYTWTSVVSGGTVSGNTQQASPIATAAINNTLVNNGPSDVTVTYTITVFNPGSPVCTGETEQVVITVRPSVNASAGSNSPVCAGQTIQLTGNSTNAGVTFSWTGPNGFMSSDQNPTINSAIPANAGVYTLIATAGGCNSPAATTTVVVNSSSNIGSAVGTNPSSCGSATGSIAVNGLSNNATYTVNYTFNGIPATPISLNTNAGGTLVIPNLVAGIYDNITATINGCASNAAGPVTLSDPAAPNAPTASSNAPICSGNTLTLNASTTSPGTALYTWSGPNGFNNNTQNPSITNATTAASGLYSVTVTINNCTSAAGTVNVLVNPTPATPVANNNGPLCTDATLNLTASSATPGVSYTWSGPNGFGTATQNPSITSVTTAEAGVYTVFTTLGPCQSPVANTNVVIHPTPFISGFGSTNPTNCASATGTIILNGLAANTTYTLNYSFNSNPAPASTLTTNAGGTLTISNLIAGTYSNVRVTLNNCVSNEVGPFILSDPAAPATPTAGSNAPICSGNTLTLNASTTSGGTATWSWTGPDGFNSDVQNPVINNVTTAASGIYSVTVTINGCVSATGTTNVLINQTPVTPTAGSNSPVCTGNTLNLSAATATPGVITYSWTGPNGFSNNTQNPSINNITLADAGNYSVTATLGSCTSAPGTTAVVVNLTPNISGHTLNHPVNCATSTGSIVLTGLTASTAYTVNYTQGATPVTATFSTDASGQLTIPNLPAATYSNISVTRNNCPSNIVGPFTLVDPTPPATPVAGSNSAICSGNTLQLNALSATAGVSYNWTGPGGFVSPLQHPVINNAQVAASGTYSVTATLNNCTSAAGTVDVIVHPTPVTPIASSNSPVCTGNTLNLGASTPSPGVSYTWTGPNGFNNAQQNPSISNVTLADAGVYSVIATATLGNCPSTPGTTTVVIHQTPFISGSSATNPTNCASATGSISLTGLLANTTYTVHYTRGATPQTTTLTSNASGTLIIPNLTAGNYSDISVTLNNCPSNQVGPFTLVDPTPPATPIATSNSPVCSGTALQLNASTVSAGTASWLWTGPDGFNSTDQNPVISSASVAASGTYQVTVTINSCTSGIGTVDVIVHQTPALPVAGSNSPVCTDSTLRLTATTSTPGGMTWSWTGPNGFNSIVQNPEISVVTMAAAGSYNVIATSVIGNCHSAPATTTVVVNPTPVITTTAFTDPTNCNTPTGTITLNGLQANTSYQVQYTFGGNAQTASLSSNASGSIVIPNLPAGTYTNIRVVRNGCPSNVIASITLTDPNPPAAPVATSNGPVCSGNTLQLNASTTSAGAITYNWTGPNNFTSSQQNPSIADVSMAANGVYSVTATLNSCVSPAGTVTVVVNATPATPVAGSNSPICADSTLQLNASTSFAGAVTWSWTGPNTFASTAQNPSIPNAQIAAGGVYTVIATATTGNCPSAPGTTNVIVNPTPVISSSTFTNPILCLSATGTIRLNGLAASTAYVVNYERDGNPVSATITSEPTGTLIIPLLPAGTYTNVRVTTLAGCPSNTVGPFVLVDPNPPAAPVASSNSPICSGETLQLSAVTSTTGTIEYNWTGPAGFNSNVQNPTIINTTPANSGTYNVTATQNNCVSAATTVLVEVTALPAAPQVSSPVNYCINTTAVPLTATTTPGNTLRWYTQPVGGTFSLTAPTPSTNVAGTTTFYVSQATPLGCEGSRAAITVIVNPDALAQYNSSIQEDCAPFVINSSIIQPVLHPTRNGSYQWFANGAPIGNGTSFPGFTITNPGDSVLIKLVAVSLFGCRNDSTESWFYTVPRPVTSFTASPTIGCGPLAVTFNNTTPLMNRFSYIWDFGNGVISTAQQPGTITFQPNPTAADTVYNVRLIAFTQCDTVISTLPITVRSAPHAIFTPDRTTGCSPLTVTFNNLSLGLNTTFIWTFGDGSPAVVTTSRAPIQHTFNTGQQDTFYVRLIAMNDCGSDTAVFDLVVAARTIDLDVVINGTQVNGCAPHAVQFFNNSSGATTFNWDFGDGNIRSTTRNIDTLTNVYLSTGTFTVFVHAANSCTDTSLTRVINVFERPTVNFAFAPSPTCVGDTIQFTNQSNALTGLLWNFGEGTTSQLSNPVHAYQAPGTYNVTLVGIRQYAPGNVCTDTISRTLNVLSGLPGSFTTNISGTCAPVTVTFTNQSLPSTLTTWNFGNGAVDTGDVVTYTYQQLGNYTVTMTARDPGGCTYQATQTINVSGPTGSFIYDHGFICGNRPVRFEANVTGTDSIRWNFGDGTIITSTANIVYHVYNQPGVYVPRITLLSGPGGTCTRLLTGPDTIRVDYVSAGFISAQVRTCGTTSVSFTDTSRSYFPMQSWQWNFGDGTGSTVRHPVHVYNASNNYPIRLIALSSSGCADTVLRNVPVQVYAAPEASVVNSPTGCVNQPVAYNSVVVSPDPVTFYSWTFSNGATGNTANMNNNYAAPGNYTAQLIAGTSFGCYDTAVSVITINPSPFVNTNPDMQICRGQSAQLNATGGLTYTWAPFTGLSCTTCPNPVATPLTTTQYVVTGVNSFGCAARDTILITVPQPIDVTTNGDRVMCIGDTVQLNAFGATTYVWSPATNLSATNIPNPIANPSVTTVYRVIGFDAHNCFQDTAYITVGVGRYPVVNVGADRVMATGEQINLTPSATNGPIAAWNWTPARDLSCATCPSPTVTAKKDICYTVTATNFFGCAGSDTMCIRVFCESSQVFIPNAFTPDGDGINDKLVIRAQGVKIIKSFRVFNRWGQLVFEKANFPPNADSHGWDGKVKGVAAPPDVYVYTCEVLCEDDTPYTYKGNTAIIK